MSEKKDLFKNTLIIGFGRLAAQFVSFLLLPLYTYYLTQEEYGAVDLIISYITLLAPLLILQLDRAAFRYLIDARSDQAKVKRVVSSTLVIALISVVIVLALYFMVNMVIDMPYARLIAFAVITLIFSTLFLQFARGFGKNDLFATASALSGATLLGMTLWLVISMDLGVSGVLWATIAANAVTIVYLFITLKLYEYISITFSESYLQKELLSFSWPLVPSAVSWWFIRTFDRTIIAIFLGVAANGVYAAASKYAIIFLALYSIFDLSWTESASKHIDSRNRDVFFSEVYNASFRVFGALGLCFIAITPFVFNLIIGSEFQEAYLLIPILVIGAFLQAMVAQYSVIYIAKKATRQVLVTSIVVALISLVFNITLIHFFGLYAAALSSVIAFGVMAAWRHRDIQRYVTITFQGNIFIKLILLYVLVSILYYINNWYLNALNLALILFVSLLFTREIFVQSATKIKERLVGRL